MEASVDEHVISALMKIKSKTRVTDNLRLDSRNLYGRFFVSVVSINYSWHSIFGTVFLFLHVHQYSPFILFNSYSTSVNDFNVAFDVPTSLVFVSPRKKPLGLKCSSKIRYSQSLAGSRRLHQKNTKTHIIEHWCAQNAQIRVLRHLSLNQGGGP